MTFVYTAKDFYSPDTPGPMERASYIKCVPAQPGRYDKTLLLTYLHTHTDTHGNLPYLEQELKA